MSFKVGICGAGRIANDDHIPIIKRMRGFDLKAVYDITPARRSYSERVYGIKSYSDLDEFLDLGLDLVIISSPSSTHKQLALRVINKGVNLIVEKPIALNSKDAREIIESAKRKRVLLSSYHNRRWDSDFITVRKIFDEGLIGKPLSLESRALFFGSLVGYGVKEFDTAWRYKTRYGGGVLLDFGTHLVDQILQLVKDKPCSVWCHTANAVWSKEVEDYFKCVIRFKSGFIAQLETSQVSRYTLPRWHITGRNGAIVCDDWIKGPVKVKYDTSAGRVAGKERIYKFKKAGKDIFYRNILRALEKKEKPLVTPEEIYNVMVVLEAARESARLSEEVKINF